MTRKKGPNDTDIHVGTRIRARRVVLGLSQEKLGEALGVTFQQVQKYEKGINRIGAGRLRQIADLLGVSVSYFYDGLPSDLAQTDGGLQDSAMLGYDSHVTAEEGRLLVSYFTRIRNPRLRRSLLDLARSMVDE